MMKRVGLFAASAIAVTSPACAATNVFLTYRSVEANFQTPKAPGTISRGLSGTGNIVFNRDLTDGTFGLSDITSFTLNHRLDALITAPAVALFATYDFDTSKLTAFDITISGGVLTAASWAFAPVPYTTSAFGVGFFPESVEYSLADKFKVYFHEPGKPRTLLATGIEGTLRSTSGAVPESSTWAMMVAGFGLMGAMLRRQSMRVVFPG